MEEQLDFLLPQQPPEAEFKQISLDKLLGRLVNYRKSVAPSRELLRSIKAWGVRQPLELTQTQDGSYILRDGRRRLAAAIELELERVPVRIYRDMDALAANILTLDANAQRTDNPIEECRAIMALIIEARERGLPPPSAREIYLATGMPVQTIRKRLKLLETPPEILEAVEAGKCSLSVAERVASLPRAFKEEIVQILADKGRLTEKDLRQVRQAVKAEAIQELPDRVFTAPEVHRHQWRPTYTRDEQAPWFVCACGAQLDLPSVLRALEGI